MIRGLYTAVSGLISQEAKQDVITNNIANANTTGYKSDSIALKGFKEVLLENYDGGTAKKPKKQQLGTLSLGSSIDETKTFFTQGLLQESSSNTDFAIEGRGFFTVEKEGKEYYKRDGSFHVNTEGFLVNSTGQRVIGINSFTGEKGSIYIGNGKISQGNNGNILIDEIPAYRLNTVDFQNYDGLAKVGDNLYEGAGAFNSNANVKQRYLEKSNVNVVNEMVEMMTVMRNFETNQKIVQIMDESLGKAANEVGKL